MNRYIDRLEGRDLKAGAKALTDYLETAGDLGIYSDELLKLEYYVNDRLDTMLHNWAIDCMFHEPDMNLLDDYKSTYILNMLLTHINYTIEDVEPDIGEFHISEKLYKD